ncbi:MAG: TAXI family TRAP transporter solute-binding subunit [Lachnospiraceae bacterium]|nr:TAXI family TRAP transporter solute-binding subunit [Lachnospiraceae bacterium]
MQTMKKLCGLMLCMCMITAALTGCSQSKRMMFGTGGTAGTYYSYGGVIAQYMKNYADVKAVAVSTGGSKVNIQSIEDGDFQLGFTQSDVMTYGWEGTRAFEKDGGTQAFRVLASLYAETVQIITLDKSIETVSDLKGKRVSIGQAGSGVYFNAIDVLEAADIGLEDIKPQYQSFEDSKEALKDGRIDAAFIVAGPPTTAITELATTNGVKLIGLDNELQAKIIEKCPYYKAYAIPAGTYPGQDDEIRTVTVEATLIVSADADEKTVYDLTAAIFDHIEDITKENAKGQELDLNTATDIMTVPYHKGAAKYYEEKGYTVNTEAEAK